MVVSKTILRKNVRKRNKELKTDLVREGTKLVNTRIEEESNLSQKKKKKVLNKYWIYYLSSQYKIFLF